MCRRCPTRQSGGWRDAGNGRPRIYAWIAIEEDGSEGFVAANVGGVWMPLIGADRARVDSLRGAAESVQRVIGLPVRLKVFGPGVVLDEIGTGKG